METQIFINEAINMAIRKYMRCKDGINSGELDTFEVVVIRTLILIYGELDIINPFKINNEKNLDNNLKKFGLKDDVLVDFKERFLNFYKNKEDALAVKQDFLNIQKILIDMFVLKKGHVLISDDEIEQFKKLLYTKEEINPYKMMTYSKYTPDSDEIINYYNSEIYKIGHKFEFKEYSDVLLNREAYQLAGFNPAEVERMKENEIINMNNKVYYFFKIKNEEKNKKEMLENAILYFKKYGSFNNNSKGYVDLLLIFSLVATGLMLVLTFSINFMR